MFDWTRVILFLTAAVLLAIAPGPGMLYVLARSLAGGKREGVLSALGTFLGGMVHVFAAALGVSIVLARSATAFATVKYLGAAYLCFLGVRMVLTRAATRYSRCRSDCLPAGSKPALAGRSDRNSQSKTALFFLSFIPQFVTHDHGHVFLQFVMLGTISVALNTTADLIVIALAGPLGQRIDPLRLPPPAKKRHGRDHDWTGSLPGNERIQVGFDA